MDRAWRWWRYDYTNSGHTTDTGPTYDVHCRWRYDAGYFVPGTPVLADDIVHVATQAPATSLSNLHGIDVDTGNQRYTSPNDDPIVELRGSPTVTESVSYVTVLDDPPLVRGYDIDSGDRVRQYHIAPLSRSGIPPILDGDTLYSVSDWTLTAVDIETGCERWSFAPGESFYGAAALVDGVLFVGSAGENADGTKIDTGDDQWPHADLQYPRLRALDATDGEVEWEVEVEVVPRTVAVDDGMVFCCGSEPYRRFTAVESPVGLSDGGLPTYGMVHAVSVNGERRWTAELDAPIRSAPAVTQGTVIIGTDEGDADDAKALIALDAETGDRIWTRVGEGKWTAASVAGDIVYAGNAEGYVVALELTDGSVVWRFETDAGVYGPPSVSGGRLYVGDANGTVYALEDRA